MKKSLLKKWKNLRTNFLSRENPYYNYVCRVLDATTRTIMMFIVSVLVNIGLLCLCKIFWYSYIATPIGQQFVRLFEGRSQIMFDILNKNMVGFSFKLVIIAFIICLIIGVICRFLHITRYLYLPRGFFGKIILWGLPLTVAVASYVKSIYGFEQWRIAYIVALIPTLCVFTGCFGLAHALFPEMGDLIRKSVLVKERIFSRFS